MRNCGLRPGPVPSIERRLDDGVLCVFVDDPGHAAQLRRHHVPVLPHKGVLLQCSEYYRAADRRHVPGVSGSVRLSRASLEGQLQEDIHLEPTFYGCEHHY
jgi:hypothetical protein